jgi:tryprostatin B 6-hydroxylase
MSPAGGITINDTFIPEGTTVVAPQYSLMRGMVSQIHVFEDTSLQELDERNFQNATEWIPERFSTKPELIHDKRAYVPWTTGTF